MNELSTFVQLGFRHIVNLQAMDHVLFLLALAAIYRPRDWRSALWVVTAFTVGHSVTLALAVTGALVLPIKLIEFLIPVTIVVTCIENIIVRDRTRAPLGRQYRPVFAAVFGLVHGAGFADYLRNLFIDHIALPLFGFNVGIELGQIVVLAFAAAFLVAADWAIKTIRSSTPEATALRVRVLTISTVVMLVAARWAIERNPW
ncbi:MAG TPA: HupE/UreJ family protein [Gemmatimonadaceae bacterium]|nr:HupE/UreJ family protein [Gemmatimonadaceae bacterium]